MKLKIIGLTLITFSIQFVFLPAVIIYFNSLLHWPVFDYYWLKAAGFFLIIIAVFVFVECFRLFDKIGLGTPAPMDPPKKLVTRGIYRYSRNPMYLGYTMVWWALLFIFGHLSLFLAAIIFPIFIQLVIVFHEEKILQKRFGEDYKRYCQQVPRWIRINL